MNANPLNAHANADRLDAIYGALWDMANDLSIALRDNALHPRKCPKALVEQHIQRLIGARLLLVQDEGAAWDGHDGWRAADGALESAKQYGFAWA